MNYQKLNLYPDGADAGFKAPSIDGTLRYYSLSLGVTSSQDNITEANYFEAVKVTTDALADMFSQTAKPEYGNGNVYKELGAHGLHILLSEALSTIGTEHLLFSHEGKAGLMLVERMLGSTGLRILSYPASPNHNRQLLDVLPLADIPEIVSKTDESKVITIDVGATNDEQAIWQAPEDERCERVVEVSLYEAFLGRDVLQLIGNNHETPDLNTWPAHPLVGDRPLLPVINN